jgi:ubiquinone/menaquinone biosynthesis C-methylase UbiE
MTEEVLRSIAEQLRKPQGTFAKEIGEKMNEGNLHMNSATIHELGAKPNDTILEIGMGNGFFVKNILSIDASLKYTGCDFSEAMVEQARINNEKYVSTGQAQFYMTNATRVPFADEYFHRIFTVNTIYFWEKPDDVLLEIKRVLKEKGEFIISIRPKSVMDNFPITKYGFSTFSRTSLEELLTRHNFSITKIIEKEEEDIDFFGEKLKNEFLIIKTVKN